MFSPSFSGPSTANRSRFVTACQQLLALAVVVAVLTPAARTITMDVRPPSDAEGVLPGHGVFLRSAERPATVPTAPVDAEVDEYSLTAPAGARLAAGALRATTRRTATGEHITSDAVPVEGYGAVGVTWAHGSRVPDDAIGLEVRYRDAGTWSGWIGLEYHDDHGPDPDSAEAANARPGTDPLLVGEVDEVQVRVEADRTAPADMKLAVIDPGASKQTARQAPEIDTGDLMAPDTADTAVVEAPASGDAQMRAVTTVAPRPKIFSRAQWGADERMRDKPSLHYHEIHAGFVHHTVNANDYTRAQVPGIIRGIYAYHTRSLGWSDVGYNFLVDRFGRIWEGRYGGVHRPVVGAHTLGYNDDAFAMSAIGNFETARPSDAMIEAYGRLFAWKLGLHGVGAGWKKTFVTSRYFQAINGHRDAGSTACPGQYLYNRLSDIRAKAKEYQTDWRGRELESNLIGSAHPDLVARRASNGTVVILPLRRANDGRVSVGEPVETGLDLDGVRNIFKAGDWDRDGVGDLVVRAGDGSLDLYRGLGKGKFDTARQIATGFGRVQLLSAVGDMTGDGYPDLMGQPKGGSMRLYPGAGTEGLRESYPAYGNIKANRIVGVGRWDFDGAADVFSRTGDRITLRPGNGPGGLVGTKPVTLDVAGYDWLVGVSDVGLTGHADLVARGKESGDLYLFPGTRKGFGERVTLGKSAGAFNYIG
ncbi:hypothetical protein HNR19_003048 [Nocardioides thalensis]|uniref:Peptidoglycan recognition protein family domain-containing protein n=1 Tax=Nocardioides thalensis TaxID=1914755 RepID=A0A853C2C8_9ACTN|nr:N-acetylmuramoyl-L-alanine amidase [Nocardioides thalensis]NYJ02350.1 hypothetical protein [Nocardioides thalensis]